MRTAFVDQILNWLDHIQQLQFKIETCIQNGFRIYLNGRIVLDLFGKFDFQTHHISTSLLTLTSPMSARASSSFNFASNISSSLKRFYIFEISLDHDHPLFSCLFTNFCFLKISRKNPKTGQCLDGQCFADHCIMYNKHIYPPTKNQKCARVCTKIIVKNSDADTLARCQKGIVLTIPYSRLT